MTNWETHNHLTPRQAAACVLFHRDPGKILMVRRNERLTFMGGHHAFPGGSVDPDDTPDFVDNTLDAEVAKRICTVVREVFEETGLFLGAGAIPEHALLRRLRRDMLRKQDTFSNILRKLNRRLDAARFLEAGMWTTPAFSPVRFQTQYFFHEYTGPEWEEAEGPESEIVGVEWMRPDEILRRWRAGAIKLSTPVVYIVRLLARLSPEDAVPYMVDNPSRNPNITERFEPRPGISIIPLRTNTLPPATHTNCVVIGEEELVVIDPGAMEGSEQARLKKHVDHLCMLGGKVTAILLTHAHADHAAAAEFLKKTYHAPICAHALTQPNPGAPAVFFDRALNEGDLIEVKGAIPWRIRCLHTPGHDPGHMCFIEESTQTLVCGDMAANPGTILISQEHGGDMTMYLQQLERLAKADVAFTIPGHGLPTWNHSGKDLFQKLIAHRLARELKIQQAIAEGADTVDKIIEKAYDDTPRELWPLARRQLQAHLTRLGIAL